MTMKTVKCPKCGKEVPWRKFCGFCGSPLPEPPSEEPKKENDLLAALDEVAKPEVFTNTRKKTSQPALKKPVKPQIKPTQPQKQPQKITKPATEPPKVAKTVEIEPKKTVSAKSPEKVKQAKGLPVWVIAVAVIVAVVVASVGGVFLYIGTKKSQLRQYLEEVLAFPSQKVVNNLKREIERRGCEIGKFQIGIKPAKSDAIEAYRERTGLVHAAGTHMIWLKLSCKKLGILPLGASIYAERPETLPPFYKDKYMIYDPSTNRMEKYIELDED